MTRIHPTPQAPSAQSRPNLPPRFTLSPVNAPSVHSPLYEPLTVAHQHTQRDPVRYLSDMSLQRPLAVPAGLSGYLSTPLRHDTPGMDSRYAQSSGLLPRNLYIVDLPLDMTESVTRSRTRRATTDTTIETNSMRCSSDTGSSSTVSCSVS
jgi:hypothetical protein